MDLRLCLEIVARFNFSCRAIHTSSLTCLDDHRQPTFRLLVSIDRSKFNMPSFDATVTEIREDSSGGCTVVLKPNELETTTDITSVLIEPKFATKGGKIHSDRIELHCVERPPIQEGQSLMVRSLDPHGE
jgi:hypothetical protein